MDCSPPASSDHGDSPGESTRVGCPALLQNIFPTQGSNPGLPHCGWILYCLNHQGRPPSPTHAYLSVKNHIKKVPLMLILNLRTLISVNFQISIQEQSWIFPEGIINTLKFTVWGQITLTSSLVYFPTCLPLIWQLLLCSSILTFVVCVHVCWIASVMASSLPPYGL